MVIQKAENFILLQFAHLTIPHYQEILFILIFTNLLDKQYLIELIYNYLTNTEVLRIFIHVFIVYLKMLVFDYDLHFFPLYKIQEHEVFCLLP